MKLFGIGALGLSAGLAIGPALADRTDILFQAGNWTVEGVTTQDGGYFCQATVRGPDDSFSIRPLPDTTVRLQFYSEDWEFGEGAVARVQVQIDRKPVRTFAGATLLQNSVFVDLQDIGASEDFALEIARGMAVFLRTQTGTDVRTYSLAGSAAAMRFLASCDATAIPDRNPFD